jgi:branched-chain amino acid transport system substrate-binding protein
MVLGSRCSVCFLLVCAVLLCGCPPRTVVIGGKEVTVTEAAKMAFDDARKTHEEGRREEAGEKLKKVLKDYPDWKNIDVVLNLLGDLAYQAERWEEAIGYFRRLVADHPQSSHYVHAAVHLGLALVKVGRTQEALPTLQSVFDDLPGEKKRAEVAGMLAESYAEAGAPVEALRWFAVLYNLTEVEGARAAIKGKLLDLIDRRMSFVHVREALEILKEQGVKGFPLDVLQFKLAKIFYHILDFARAKEALEDFVAAYPDHEKAGEAGKLLKKIMDRHRVHPQTVGVLLPLTGEYREYGRRALEGIQLGAGIFEEAKGGADAEAAGGPVLVIRDTAGDPDRAVTQLEDLVFNEHVVAVIGPMVAKETYSAAVKAQELEVPIVTLSIRKDITEVGSYVFRNFLTLTAQARALVSHAMDRLGVKRFAVLYPNDWYGVEFANAFWDEVERRKGEIRAAESYEPDEKNFAVSIKKMVGRYYLEARWDFTKEKNRIKREFKSPLQRKRAMEKLFKKIPPMVDFQALFVPDYVDKVVMIAPALAFEDIVLYTESNWQIDRIKKSLGRDKLDMVYLLGGNGWNSPNVIQWAKRYVQGSIFCDGFFLQSNRPATKLFVGKFKANFDRDPSMVEAEAYDTARILKGIIEKKRPGDRRAFRDHLLQVKGFEGATGDTTFGPDGEAEKNIFLLTIKKEEILEVEKEPPADAGSTG